MLNYLTSLRTSAKLYSWDTAVLSHHMISAYMKNISRTSKFSPISKDMFNTPTLAKISKACETLFDPPLFRAAFLLAFFGDF